MSNSSKLALIVTAGYILVGGRLVVGAGRDGCASVSNPVLNVCLVNHTQLTTDVEQLLMAEAGRLWISNGVTLTWSDDSVQNAATAADVYVTLTTDPAPVSQETGRRALASILFTKGQPTSLITVFAVENRRLLESTRVNDQRLSERPWLLRQRLLGRMLGRVVAHEIGHFLFRSREHASRGLMRANPSVIDLISPTTERFRVVAPHDVPCAK